MLQEFLDAIGFGLCHQLPERSLFGGSIRVPVCARDTGIYVGFAAAFILLGILHRDRPTRVAPPVVNILLGIGVAAMVFDGASSYLGLRPTTNELRLLTGLLTGYAIAAWIMPIMSGELWHAAGSGRILAEARSAVPFFASVLGAYALVWWVAPFFGALFPVFVAVTIVGTFVVVNLVIVSLLPPFNRAARSFRDTLPAIGVALVLTAVELLASSALKGWLIGLAG